MTHSLWHGAATHEAASVASTCSRCKGGQELHRPVSSAFWQRDKLAAHAALT
jgi:hypothetical protein